MKSIKDLILLEVIVFGIGFLIGYKTGKNDLVDDIIKSIKNKKT
jgi:hypothetical protein